MVGRWVGVLADSGMRSHCVWVCVCEKERERVRDRERQRGMLCLSERD